MKKLAALTFCLTFLFCASFPQALNFAAEETYIAYYPASSYANITEYNIQYKKECGNLEKDVESLKSKIKSAKYAEEKFQLKDFFSAEESLSSNGKSVNGTYDLLTSERATLELAEEIFSCVMGTSVKFFVQEDKVCMTFDGTGLSFGEHNCERGYKKGKTVTLEWPNRISKMELSFSKKNSATEKIAHLLPEKIQSPEKTEEEIDYLKNAYPELSGVEKKYQDDCDIVRLEHLAYYANLIEEYKEKTGHYPLQDKGQKQIYAFIFNGMQKEYFADTNPNPHECVAPKDFFAEMEKGLVKKVQQLYDPQYVPTTKPVFYIYMIQGDTYYFAVHLSKYYPFSTRVAANYYKVQVSNKSYPASKIYTIKELEQNASYKEAVAVPVKNEKYFSDRKAKHIREY
ncbi:MAG: hypothetical protein J6X11_07425 [Treponema sp.]|nr:hypothetical protein [Treponema sp.]MBR4384935.1 hypothetical protein [Treponema sp.]